MMRVMLTMLPDTEACIETQYVLSMLRKFHEADPCLLESLLCHAATASPAHGDVEAAIGAKLIMTRVPGMDAEVAQLGTLGLLNAVLHAAGHTQIGVTLNAVGGVGSFIAVRHEP
jgi:hypothetical protein